MLNTATLDPNKMCTFCPSDHCARIPVENDDKSIWKLTLAPRRRLDFLHFYLSKPSFSSQKSNWIFTLFVPLCLYLFYSVDEGQKKNGRSHRLRSNRWAMGCALSKTNSRWDAPKGTPQRRQITHLKSHFHRLLSVLRINLSHGQLALTMEASDISQTPRE